MPGKPQTDSRPTKAIRRFDVFAEYNRLDALKDGRPADQAKGHGIWLANVVASRRSAPKTESDGSKSTSKATSHLDPDAAFKSVGGELQTDATFDHDIIARMGPDFYRDIFAPAIKAAFDDGRKYEDIRDSIRTDWIPANR